MAKLREDFLEEGRDLIRAQDLDGVMAWVTRSKVMINHDVVRSIMAKCFTYGDTEKALKMFDAGFKDADPVADRIAAIGRFGCVVFVFLGLLGGVVYLFQSW